MTAHADAVEAVEDSPLQREGLAALPLPVGARSMDARAGAPAPHGARVGESLEEGLAPIPARLARALWVSLLSLFRADLHRGALMRPARYGGADLEQWVVQQHKLAVGGQAAVRLEAVEWLVECAVERRERRVRTVRAAEPVGV